MTSGSISAQSARIISRTRGLIDAARAQGITIRVLGGIAILMHSHEPLPAGLVREVRDADLVVEKGRVKHLGRLLRDLSYAENKRFNLTNGNERLIFFDPEDETQLDVFVGTFRMCHSIALDARLGVEQFTLPLAEALLTKLQIVQLNEKDIKDILLLILQHETAAEADTEAVNLSALAAPCGRDWGLYRTVVDNLARVRESLTGMDLSAADAASIRTRIDTMCSAIEAQPKSASWKLRAVVGTRMRWYELPEEVAGAITIASD